MTTRAQQVWLVTGSSRGLGRAIAVAVLEAGHHLVATARNPDDLADLATGYGDQVRAVALDVRDSTAARQAVAVAVAEFGHLDVVVNNAGYANLDPIEDVTEESFRDQMDTNFYGVVHVTRAAIPVMRVQGSGHVIQISSIGGRFGSPGLAAYQSAKFAVGGFSEVLAHEVGPLGINVTVIEPGGFRTDWAGSSMTVADLRPEYAPTVGTLATYLRTNAGAETGDPTRAARIILDVADMDDPPLRLLLASSAVDLNATLAAARASSDQRHEALSRSADFPSAH